MRITVNGSEEEAPAATVAELIIARGLTAEFVVVEHNGTILTRGEWAGAKLAAGDRDSDSLVVSPPPITRFAGRLRRASGVIQGNLDSRMRGNDGKG